MTGHTHSLHGVAVGGCTSFIGVATGCPYFSDIYSETDLVTNLVSATD